MLHSTLSSRSKSITTTTRMDINHSKKKYWSNSNTSQRSHVRNAVDPRIIVLQFLKALNCHQYRTHYQLFNLAQLPQTTHFLKLSIDTYINTYKCKSFSYPLAYTCPRHVETWEIRAGRSNRKTGRDTHKSSASRYAPLRR